MEAYLNGTLSAGERAQFEKLLAEDPFAQDALEGMQAAKNQADVKVRIASIKKKIRTQTGGREGKAIKLHWANYAWAAVVLGMLVGVGFLMVTYLNKNTDTSLAQNEAPQEILSPAAQDSFAAVAPATTTAVDSLTTPGTTAFADSVMPAMNGTISANAVGGASGNTYNWTSETNVSSASNNVPPPSAKKNMQTGYITTATDANSNTVKPATASKVTADELSKTKRAEPVKADAEEKAVRKDMDDKAAEGKKQESANQRVAAPKIEDTKAGSGGTKVVPTQAEAMQNFNAGRYKESSEQFETILKSQPNNADAQYFGGVSDYLNGNLSKSEKQFDKLLKGGNRYTEGSKWYKANILIKKGKKEEAKKILQDLSNTNNSYKERATNKLKEL